MGVWRASHMSIVKDLATEATDSLTCSMIEGWASAAAAAVVVVVGAGSPANLDMSSVSREREWIPRACWEMGERMDVLIRHDDDEPFGGILVGLQLVVGAVYSCASGEEE